MRNISNKAVSPDRRGRAVRKQYKYAHDPGIKKGFVEAPAPGKPRRSERMKMDPERVLKAVAGFIQLIEQGNSSDESHLKFTLDELALASNLSTDFVFDERELPDAPKIDQVKIRDLVALKFPEYGMYNLPEDVAGNLCDTKLMLGCAHDDLQDIYRDLKEVLTRQLNR